MNSLKNSLTKIPSDREALVIDSCTLSYEDLQNLILENGEVIKKLQASSIAINARNRFEFAKLLFLLDGEVNSMLFLPQDIDKSLHDRYYKEASVEYEVYLDNNVLKFNKIVDEAKSNQIQDTKWIIPTSGTTNIPKLVAHTFDSLTRTTKCDIEKGSFFRWGLVFDIYRFSGIQVYLQAMLSGSTLIISEADMTMPQILNNLSKNRCNALSATASFWRKVMMSKEANNLELKVITLGGEIVDETILQALQAKYSSAKILHIYASTEAGVGFSVQDGYAGFPTSFLEDGFDEVNLKISDTNTLMIKNKKETQKYLSCNDLYQKDGYIDTGDVVEIKDNRVYFLGRDSGAINVGGNKVQPEEVEQALLDSMLLHEAFVYGKKNSMMGNLVCADVVLKDKTLDTKLVKNELITHCRKKIDNYKIPAMIRFVDELQTTQSGKLKRS